MVSILEITKTRLNNAAIIKHEKSDTDEITDDQIYSKLQRIMLST